MLPNNEIKQKAVNVTQQLRFTPYVGSAPLGTLSIEVSCSTRGRCCRLVRSHNTSPQTAKDITNSTNNGTPTNRTNPMGFSTGNRDNITEKSSWKCFNFMYSVVYSEMPKYITKCASKSKKNTFQFKTYYQDI